MVAKYNDPARTLREWAAPLRVSQPDVWNEFEDLAQSIEATSGVERIKELEAELQAADRRAEEAESQAQEGHSGDAEARTAIDNALALVGGGKVRDMRIEDAGDELQRLARRALALSALFDAIGLPLKHDQAYCAAAVGDGDLLPWAKGWGVEFRRRLDRLDALEKWAEGRP